MPWIFAFILASSFVSAAQVAYIVQNPSYPNSAFISALNEMGLSYALINDDNLASTDFSQYEMILVGDETLSNTNLIPVKQKKSLIANHRYLADWNIAYKTYDYHFGNGYTSGKFVVNNTINQNMTSPVRFYTTYNSLGPIVWRLPNVGPYASGRACGIINIIATNNVDAYPIIGVINKNGKLWQGKSCSSTNLTAQDKIVYFGPTDTMYWTTDTRKLFKNSFTWLLTDFDSPQLMDITARNITNESVILSWGTDKPANASVFYGTDLNLGLTKTNSTFSTTHEFLLENLQEITKYYFKVRSCNQNSYCANSSVYNFPTKDLTPPYLISDPTADASNDSANISVTTNELSNLTVFYGLDENSLTGKASKSSFTAIGYVFISSLSEKTTYSYKIKMCDNSSNCANSSIFTFATLDLTPPNPPQNLLLEVINANNNIKVKWNPPEGEAAADYKIYISNDKNLASFDFETPNVTSTSNEYIDNSAYLIPNRYYIVRSQDAAGNEEKNTNVVGKFDLTLNQGYNLISLPLTPFDSSVNKVMHQDQNYNPISYITRFNAISQQLETINYNEATNQWNTAAFSQLNTLQGYFFKSDNSISFTTVGYPTPSKSLNIMNGMNLVGLTILDNKQIDEAIIQSPSNYNITDIALRVNNGIYNNIGIYNLATYYPAQGSWFVLDNFDIKPGIGYWVKANKNFSLIVE